MSDEIEAAGAAVTAGLAASAIERGGRGHGGDACPNCGGALMGAFCHVCGQPSHISRSIGHMWHDFLHGIMHFDGKAWRTLPLLFFRPGTLTHRYIHGQRARFIGPVALFLFTIFLMFFVFSLLGDGRWAAQPALSETERAEQTALMDRVDARLAADLAAAEAAGDAEEANDVRMSQRMMARAREAGRLLPGMTVSEAADGVSINYSLGEGGRLEPIFEEIRAAHAEGRITVNTGNPTWDKKILAKLGDPEFAWYKIQNTAYKFSFLLIPLSLPFMWLIFFWKRGVTLFDHSVFLLYSLSFMSFLFLVGMVVGRVAGDAAGPVLGGLTLAPLAHMFFQLKGGYGLGWFSAAWRTIFLLFAGAIALGIFLALIFMMGLLG